MGRWNAEGEAVLSGIRECRGVETVLLGLQRDEWSGAKSAEGGLWSLESSSPQHWCSQFSLLNQCPQSSPLHQSLLPVHFKGELCGD